MRSCTRVFIFSSCSCVRDRLLMGCGWQAAERGRASAEEELRKERAARKQQDEKVRDLEQRVRSLQTQTSPPAMSGTPEKRKLDLLEKQVAQLKQDKQREEMRRLEAESTLKSVERRANELHSQVRSKLFRGRVVYAHLFTSANLSQRTVFGVIVIAVQLLRQTH